MKGSFNFLKKLFGCLCFDLNLHLETECKLFDRQVRNGVKISKWGYFVKIWQKVLKRWSGDHLLSPNQYTKYEGSSLNTFWDILDKIFKFCFQRGITPNRGISQTWKHQRTNGPVNAQLRPEIYTCTNKLVRCMYITLGKGQNNSWSQCLFQIITRGPMVL